MTNKKTQVAICGASDCFPDSDWPNVSWMECLESKLPDHEIRYYSVEGASNFLISLQVEKAMAECDVIIVNFTSSVREEYRIGNTVDESKSIIDRVYRYQYSADADYSLACSTGLTVEKHPVLSSHQKQLIKEYFTEFFDLPVAIHKNYIFINHTLQKLASSKKQFIFSTGGFEHTSYMSAESRYQHAFDEFGDHRSGHNLWDYITDFKKLRPYFHITDEHVTNLLSDYYKNFVLNNKV